MSKSSPRRQHLTLTHRAALMTLPRDERGAATAEYAAVVAAGTGFAGVLIALLKSDFGKALLEVIIKFFLKMVGVEV